MVNNVIEVVSYVIAARPSLLNFVIADKKAADIVPQAPVVLAAALAHPPAGGGQAADQDTEEATDKEDGQEVVLDLAKALANRTVTLPPA
jgi:hypothetical protein